jgi:hypothetical protein
MNPRFQLQSINKKSHPPLVAGADSQTTKRRNTTQNIRAQKIFTMFSEKENHRKKMIHSKMTAQKRQKKSRGNENQRHNFAVLSVLQVARRGAVA